MVVTLVSIASNSKTLNTNKAKQNNADMNYTPKKGGRKSIAIDLGRKENTTEEEKMKCSVGIAINKPRKYETEK